MITKPVKALVGATRRIGKKEFDVKVPLNSKDEFGSLARAINEMTTSLKEKDAEQRKFYENISHEIKTPLTVIRGYAEGLKTDIFKNEEKILDAILRECTVLKKQIENAIYLSKLESFEQGFEIGIHNINALIGKALNKMESVILLNDIDIDFEPSEDHLIHIDHDKVVTVLTNVLTNCLKYTKDTISIEVFEKSKWLIVKICDNGPGFSKELLENPFSRSVVGEKEGTGIGLSIIKKVMEGHDGKIHLNNCETGGACYELMFRMSDDAKLNRVMLN